MYQSFRIHFRAEQVYYFFLATYLMNLPLCPTSERFVVSNSCIHAIYSGADLGVRGRVLPVLHFGCVAWL